MRTVLAGSILASLEFRLRLEAGRQESGQNAPLSRFSFPRSLSFPSRQIALTQKAAQFALTP